MVIECFFESSKNIWMTATWALENTYKNWLQMFVKNKSSRKDFQKFSRFLREPSSHLCNSQAQRNSRNKIKSSLKFLNVTRGMAWHKLGHYKLHLRQNLRGIKSDGIKHFAKHKRRVGEVSQKGQQINKTLFTLQLNSASCEMLWLRHLFGFVTWQGGPKNK